MVAPKVGLFACFSGASNTGSLTGMAALEAVKSLGSATVGVCSLPAVLNQVARQTDLIAKIGKIIVIDGCHQNCAKNLLAQKGFVPDIYLNLEADLQIIKQGPFTSLDFSSEELEKVVQAITAAVQKLLQTEPQNL